MKLYRYEDRVYSTVSIDPGGNEHYGTTDPRIELHEYEVTKETPSGYWIDIFSKKWVSKTSKKRFAHSTIEAAWRSFQRRKEVQCRIYSSRLAYVQRVMALPQPR